MHKAIEDYIDRLQGQKKAAAAALDGLPTEALDWVPGEGMSSMGGLAAHMAGSARYLIGDIIGQQEVQRDRDAEFATAGQDAATLIALLDASMQEVLPVIEPLTPEDLDQMHFSRRHGKDFSVMWVLVHVLEHWAEHVGHLGITRQLWEQGIGR